MNKLIIDKNTIFPSKSFSNDEAIKAKDHWKITHFNYYVKEQPWSQFIAERVLEYSPRSVFEFGCNAGKNIEALLGVSSINCYGVDPESVRPVLKNASNLLNYMAI